MSFQRQQKTLEVVVHPPNEKSRKKLKKKHFPSLSTETVIIVCSFAVFASFSDNQAKLGRLLDNLS